MTGVPFIVHLTPLGDALTLEWADGQRAEFASIWLRDNCRDDRDSHSGQRLKDIADLPDNPRITAARFAADALVIDWQDESTPARFDVAWLLQQASAAASLPPERRIATWLDGGDRRAECNFEWTRFAELTSPASKLRWMTGLLRSGLAFLRDVPASDAAILEVVALIGRLCETNYGAVFDVRSVPHPENLAYSDLGLGLHTDNPYRDPVPGFQALHVLIASAAGGDSLFGDGFALCDHFRRVDPQAFDTLAKTPVAFHYRSRDAELYARRPIIQLACTGEVAAVHYNNRSIAPLPLIGRAATAFYEAYRRFAVLLKDPRHHLKVRLRSGELVIFDNQRILHGRTAFSTAAHARHLRGCYLTRDSVYSEAALLRRHLSAGAEP